MVVEAEEEEDVAWGGTGRDAPCTIPEGIKVPSGVPSLSMVVAIRVFRSILRELYERTGNFPNSRRVLAKGNKSLWGGLSGNQLRRQSPPPELSTFVKQMTADNPSPRAKDADAVTGRSASQQELWQLLHTLTGAGTPNVFQFFVICLWLALIDVAELVKSGDVEQVRLTLAHAASCDNPSRIVHLSPLPLA